MKSKVSDHTSFSTKVVPLRKCQTIRQKDISSPSETSTRPETTISTMTKSPHPIHNDANKQSKQADQLKN